MEPLVNLIVNYLPSNLTDDGLRRLFEPYGALLSTKIVTSPDGKSLCYGFVKYYEPESASAAINNLNGIRIYNKVLKVAHALPKIPHTQRANNLLIKNLPKTIKKEDLETIFRPYGKMMYTRILYEPAVLYTKISVPETECLSKGMAFVRFEKLVDAEEAMSALNGTIPPGFKKPLEIKMTQNTKGKPSSVYNLPELMDTTDQSYASLNDTTLSIEPFFNNNQNGQFVPLDGQMTEGKNLYVRNFSPKIDEMSLCELFRSYGNVLWLKIARHRDGTSRKYGFVEMETENGATQAIKHLNGIFIMGYKLCVQLNNNPDSPPFSVKCDKNFRKSN